METQKLPDLNSCWQKRSESLAKFLPAFLKLQSELPPVKKDADNPFFHSKYAELSSILEAVQPLFTKHGFILIQEPGNYQDMLMLTTTILHISGEYIRSSVAFPVVKKDPQGYGSAITYARRYALQSILGLPVIDDDGNHGSGKANYTPPRPPVVTPQPRKVNQPTATPRPADQIPPKANTGAWTGEAIVHGGKYKGLKWMEVDRGYLKYVIDAPKSSPSTKDYAQQEIERRLKLESPDFDAINQEAEGFNPDDYVKESDFNFYK